jgi:hypothetical protein
MHHYNVHMCNIKYSTHMQSTFCIVDSQWVMAIVVRPLAARSSASCTTFSESESSAEVA